MLVSDIKGYERDISCIQKYTRDNFIMVNVSFSVLHI